MKTALVLILSASDVAALPTCAASLKHSGVKRLWLIHAPSLGVTNTSVANSFDERLKTLKRQEQEAAARSDYSAAANFKQEAESVQIERDVAVKKGWEAVPEQERNAAYDRALAPVCDPKAFSDIKVTVLREDYQPDGLFGMMQGMMAQWPTDIQHGKYSIVWPQGCTDPREKWPMVELEPTVRAAAPTVGTTNSSGTLTYLEAQKVAKDLGLNTHKMKLPQVLELIAAKQAELAAA